MFDFKPSPDQDVLETYRELANAVDALTMGEPDAVANMANVAALLSEFLPNLNWAGFYRVGPALKGGEELILGPFVGRPACIRIPFGQGVCGAAARDAATQLIEDVHAFPGHIACSTTTLSEIVVPILTPDDQLLGVLDVDSNHPAAFDTIDQTYLEQLCQRLGQQFAID